MSISNQNPNFELIRQWAEARNLIKGATPQAQFVKLIEEFGEFTTGLGALDTDEIKDGLGDTVVVLTILAAQLGTTIEDCIQYASDNDEEVAMLNVEDTLTCAVRLTMNYFSYLATGISKKTPVLVARGIGNSYITLETAANCLNMDFDECIQMAYDEIKDRKGKMVDGVFIKEADFASMGITE